MAWFEPIKAALSPILQIGYHFLIVATVLCVAALIIAANSRRFAKLSDAFFKLTHFQRVVAIMCIVIATVYAQKDSGDDDDGASPPRIMMAPMVTPTASDVEDLATPTNSDLMISGIEVGTNSVALGISWTDALPLANNSLDLFASWDLLSGSWTRLAEIDLGTASSNIVAEIDFSLYPTNALRSTAFFRIATQADSDMDGLSDMYEEWVLGTDPENPDTDGDGMPDGWEVEHNYDPFVLGEELDSDLDGVPDSKELALGTNIYEADSDGDGVDDGDEYYRGTNPLLSDTDGDGMSDYEEWQLGTDPLDLETYEVSNDDAPLQSTSFMSVDDFFFDGEQGDTNVPGDDYEMVDDYDISIRFEDAVPSFSVLGIYPPAGTTRRYSGNMIGRWYKSSSQYNTNKFYVTATGAYFKAKKTGRFTFQVQIDDSINMQIGPSAGETNKVSLITDFYGTNPISDSAIFIENELYPIVINADNHRGGPAELTFLTWGAFEPIKKPQLAVKFSSDAVIFENGYRNVPNKYLCEARSSNTDVMIGVKSGGLGGVLRVQTQNDARLEHVSDDECLNFTCQVEPNVTRYWCGTYKGLHESSTTNDIVVVATFTENRTGIVTAYTNSLTSIRVELTASRLAPQSADPHRHVFGVAEDVAFRHYPSCANVDWQFISGDGASDILVRSEQRLFECPRSFTQSSVTCTARVSTHSAVFTTNFRVFRPRIEGRNPRVNINSADVSPVLLEAGHLVLYLDMYATPFFVSFRDIQIMEIADESQSGTHDGYFDDQSRGGDWSHTADNGAGVWNRVVSGNYYATDKIGPGHRYERPWSYGWKVWPIPMQWGMGNRACGQITPNPTSQKFILYEDGTCEVQKHTYSARRNIYGVIWINGKIILWPW